MDSRKLLIKAIGQENFQKATESWGDSIKEISDEIPIESHRIFIVHGKTNQFDFTTLPSGSYSYWCVNGYEAWQIKANGFGLERLIAATWSSLLNCPPEKVASFILIFSGNGIKNTHRVLKDKNSLLEMESKSEDGYKVNLKEFSKVGSATTEWSSKNDLTANLQALTLMGWMHDKKNIGIEQIEIQRSGEVKFNKRKIYSTKIFTSTPSIRY